MQYACSTTDKSTYLYFTEWNKRKSYTSKNETKLLISEQTFKFKSKLLYSEQNTYILYVQEVVTHLI